MSKFNFDDIDNETIVLSDMRQLLSDITTTVVKYITNGEECLWTSSNRGYTTNIFKSKQILESLLTVSEAVFAYENKSENYLPYEKVMKLLNDLYDSIKIEENLSADNIVSIQNNNFNFSTKNVEEKGNDQDDDSDGQW